LVTAISKYNFGHRSYFARSLTRLLGKEQQNIAHSRPEVLHGWAEVAIEWFGCSKGLIWTKIGTIRSVGQMSLRFTTDMQHTRDDRRIDCSLVFIDGVDLKL